MKEELRKRWEECLRLIKKQLGNDAAFAMWFEPTEAKSLRGNHLTLTLASGFCKELYEGEYFPIFSKALQTVFGPSVSVTYEVPVVKDAKGATIKYAGQKPAQHFPGEERVAKSSVKRQSISKNTGKREESGRESMMPKLNEALSFENYCVGSSNKLPWTIAESIARKPVNSTFNPFFLYGDVGVGKTHLMQAIGLQVKKNNPDMRVVFLPMKEFQRLYQNAYLQHEIPAFLQWFMKCDLLLFDDLQEIASSEGTLNNALFPIFSHLQMQGKQLVFTCDRPPQDLKDLEDRLIDRFKWGIVEKLEKPDTALRRKILTFKAKKNGLDLPSDVIDYIAGTRLNSVREIESIVLGIMTRAINLGIEIDMKLAREVVEKAVRPSKKREINFDMIVETVAEHYRLNPDVIFSKSRVKEVAEARMVIMYLAQRMLGISTGAIGRKLARKHSTVIHGIKTVEERMEADSEFAETLGILEGKVYG